MRGALVKARAVSRVMEAVREKSCPHIRLLVRARGWGSSRQTASSQKPLPAASSLQGPQAAAAH
jgi:hypothetical protein